MAKHKLSITLIILGLFLATQIVGLIVINQHPVPTFLSPTMPEVEFSYGYFLVNLLISFFIAITLFLFLIKYKYRFFLKFWFFAVVTMALSISINAIFRLGNLNFAYLTALVIALPIAILKIYRHSVVIHNLTEILVYPGIAAIFTMVFNPWSILVILILISIYDIWAVWHSGLMQKMVKFQMDELHVFGGLLIPYFTDKQKKSIELMKQKLKNKKITKEKIRKSKMKISVGMLGGGDIVFPLITAGVFMQKFGLTPAIYIIVGALAALTYLFCYSKKGRHYPAMPYITTGIFIALLIWFLTVLF